MAMREKMGVQNRFGAVVALAVGTFATICAMETVVAAEMEVATFAGGCFWCVESDFDNVPGVERTVSGYTGGHVENPSYKQVSSDETGHREAVQIFFDPMRVSYAELVEVLWRSVDPTDAGGQFCDRGKSYETAIFVSSKEQREIAKSSKQALEKSKVLPGPIATTIEDAGPFYPAEEYHQDYYRKNPVSYHFYRYRCGRNARVETLWGEEAYRGVTKH